MKAPLNISGSVGQGGKNKKEDVEAVQGALNLRAKAGLEVDGKCGSKTIQAIKDFQKKAGFAYPDGLVEPGKKTEAALRGEKVSVEEEKGGTGSGTAKGGAGQTS